MLCCETAAAEEVDTPGSRDHRVFRRIPGFFIDRFDFQEVGTYTFQTQEGSRTVDGRFFRIDYRLQTGAEPVEVEQIIGNHVAAVTALGGDVLARETGAATFRIEEEATETWVRLIAWGNRIYGLRIIERPADPLNSALDPSAIAEDLQKTGRAAIYGLQFDDGAPSLVPQSTAILAAIADVLKSYPDLKLFIVSHTDNTGDFLVNLNLSKRRAHLLVRTLLNNYGIEPDRLQAFGVGPLAPLASNASEKGRALNRRVELVVY